MDFYPFLGAQGSGFQNRLDLHFVDFGVGDAQAHTAMAEHGVDLGQRADLLEDFFLLVDRVHLKMAVLELFHALR